jgi:hypothetical protein
MDKKFSNNVEPRKLQFIEFIKIKTALESITNDYTKKKTEYQGLKSSSRKY